MARSLTFAKSISLHYALRTPGVDVPVTVVADTSTPVPGGTGDFTFMTFPVISQNNVAFGGGGGSQTGNIYIRQNGILQLALAVGSGQPGTSGKFTGLGMPWLSGNQFVLFGTGSTGVNGIYVKTNDVIAAVADTTTRMPDGGTFSSFENTPQSDGAHVVFGGTGHGVSGIYLASQSGIETVADTSTPIPGGAGTFINLESPTVSGNTVAFFGSHPGTTLQAGLYWLLNGKLSLIADLNTTAPGSFGTFNAFGGPAVSGNTVVFHATTSDGNEGMYAKTGNDPVRVIADLNTPVPGGSGTFTAFQSDPAIDGNMIAFRAFSGIGAGLYVTELASLVKIIDQNDSIEGKHILYLGMSDGDLSNGVVSFYAVTGPGVFGNYTTPIPNLVGLADSN